MSFKDGQISSQKVNLKHTLLSAGNGGYAIRQPSERRIVSGDPPHGEFEAAHCRPPYIVVTLITNIQKGELSAATRRGKAPCTLGGGTRGFPLGYNSEAI